jgi:hypothetical protein
MRGRGEGSWRREGEWDQYKGNGGLAVTPAPPPQLRGTSCALRTCSMHGQTGLFSLLLQWSGTTGLGGGQRSGGGGGTCVHSVSHSVSPSSSLGEGVLQLLVCIHYTAFTFHTCACY